MNRKLTTSLLGAAAATIALLGTVGPVAAAGASRSDANGGAAITPSVTPSPTPSPTPSVTPSGQTGTWVCPGISFTVLHNDRSGGVTLPAGEYRVSSPNLGCKTASTDFTTFLSKDNGNIPGWTGKQIAKGYETYSRKNSKQTFTVKLVKPTSATSRSGTTSPT